MPRLSTLNRPILGRDAPSSRALPTAQDSRSVNLAGLERLVLRCLADAGSKDDPAKFLRLNAGKVEAMLRQLERWAAATFDRAVPAHLEGLTAFDLAAAMDRLNQAARKREREGVQ